MCQEQYPHTHRLGTEVRAQVALAGDLTWARSRGSGYCRTCSGDCHSNFVTAEDHGSGEQRCYAHP